MYVSCEDKLHVECSVKVHAIYIYCLLIHVLNSNKTGRYVLGTFKDGTVGILIIRVNVCTSPR